MHAWIPLLHSAATPIGLRAPLSLLGHFPPPLVLIVFSLDSPSFFPRLVCRSPWNHLEAPKGVTTVGLFLDRRRRARARGFSAVSESPCSCIYFFVFGPGHLFFLLLVYHWVEGKHQQSIDGIWEAFGYCGKSRGMFLPHRWANPKNFRGLGWPA